MFIAKDSNQFKTLFVNKLKDMLSADELGAFILVLANSHQDAFLQNELHDDLQKTFVALKENYSAGRLSAPQDDIDVFEKLLALDLDDMPIWQYKSAGEWEVVYNAIRKMRPMRSSSQVLSSIKQPYDEIKFHFNKPFLKPEILWQGSFNGLSSRVLFNKFPFCDYHLIIAVSAEENLPQLLTPDMHRYAFSLMTEMAKITPGFGMGFNSLAAGASVNHFHFQAFVREQKFSIEKKCWSHNGGDVAYPLAVKCFSDVETSWHYIEQLTEENQAFNCLYLNDVCYVVPRMFQGAVALPEWLVGAGWVDIAGAIAVSDADMFDAIDASSVSHALTLMRQ